MWHWWGRSFLIALTVTYTARGEVEIGILRGISSTLNYLPGSCSWITPLNIAGVVANATTMGQQRILEGTGVADMFPLKCVVDGIDQLTALVIIFEINEVPSPVSLSLDKEIINWSHVFQPSDLPSEFELDHGFTISYLVNVTDRDSSGEKVESLASNETSLNVSQYLDHCSRQEFTVQALVNDMLSQSRSLTTNTTAPVLKVLSSQLLVEDDNVSVNIVFSLEERECLSHFNIVINGLTDTISFNITSSDRERGTVTYTLSNVSTDDVCSVRGSVYGSNDIGDSEPVQIQLPEDCPSAVFPTSSLVDSPTSNHNIPLPSSPTHPPTDTTTDTAAPPPVTTSQTVVIVTVSVSGPLVIVILVCAIIGIALVMKKKNKVIVTGGFIVVDGPPPDHDEQDLDENKQIDSSDVVAAEAKPSRVTVVQYSDVVPDTTGTGKKKFTVKEKSEYATIDHVETENVRQHCEQARAEAELHEEAEEADTATAEVSIDPNIVGLSMEHHHELLVSALKKPIQGHWMELGTHLDLSENFLDETETNIEKEEDCLEEILQNWLKYQESSMEALGKALTKMNLSTLTFDPSSEEFVFLSEGSDVEEVESAPPAPERD